MEIKNAFLAKQIDNRKIGNFRGYIARPEIRSNYVKWKVVLVIKQLSVYFLFFYHKTKMKESSLNIKFIFVS